MNLGVGVGAWIIQATTNGIGGLCGQPISNLWRSISIDSYYAFFNYLVFLSSMNDCSLFPFPISMVLSFLNVFKYLSHVIQMIRDFKEILPWIFLTVERLLVKY